MNRFVRRCGVASMALAGLISAVAGCGGDGAPPVSTSRTLVTITGTISYKGNLVNEGEVRFNPANASRRDAPTAVAPIKEGKYTIQAMVGENSVSCKLPKIGAADPSIAFASFIYDVPTSGGTYDVDLSKK